MFSRFIILALAFGFLRASAARAQDVPGSVRESAQVVLIEVPVRVVNRNGEPIRNLTAQDFELSDDGRKQTIIGFDAIDLAQKGMEGASSERVPPAARRHFLILFDLSFAQPKSVLAARRAAKEFVLSGMGDRDFAAVATFSVEKGVRLLVTFTQDRVQLARAVDTLGIVEPQNLETDPLAFLYDVMAAYGGGRSGDTGLQDSLRNREGQAAGLIETLQTLASLTRARLDQYQRARIMRLTDSLDNLARALDSVQGHKDVIYLSEGFESRLLVGTKETEQEHDWILTGEQWKVDADKRFGNSHLQTQVDTMSEIFRRTDCAIHAVDISGLRTDTDGGLVSSVRGENALFEIANATGGEVLRNDNDFHAQLSRLLARTNLVYVLAFRPRASGHENRFHDLKVRVRTPGARVSARAGYYEKKSFRAVTPLERALAASDIVANEMPVSDIPVRILASPHPEASEAASVPVLVEIPGQPFLAGGTRPRAAAEIYAYAYDTESRVRDFFAQTVDVDLAAAGDRFARGGLRYYGQLILSPGDYRVRVLVRNGETGRMGFAAQSLHVPDFSGGRPYIAPPIFLVASDGGILVRGSSGMHRETPPASDELLSPSEGNEMLPAALPELKAGSPSRVSVAAYHLEQSPTPSGTLKIGAQVLSEDGRPLGEGAIRVLGKSLPDAEGKQMLLVAFTPEGLSPGRYALRVFLQDPTTGRGGHASTPFLVR
jgi:VWFA-related protein